MFQRLLILGSALAWSILSPLAQAQLTADQARSLTETLLSRQNPLLVVEEIAHEGLSLRADGSGYIVSVADPRFPGRPAFAESLDLSLQPLDTDRVQVRVTSIPTSATLDDGAQVSFTPTSFSGLYSLSQQGFEDLQLGLQDLTYGHRDGSFSLDSFSVVAGRQDGVPILRLSARGYGADIGDVMDFQETVQGLDMSLSFPNGSPADLLILANRLFEILLDSGDETTNAAGKVRALPADLRGLSLNLSLTGLGTRWMALLDSGQRDVISDTQVPNLSLSLDVSSAAGDLADLRLGMSLAGASVTAPRGGLQAQAGPMAFSLNVTGLPGDSLGGLFSMADGAQTAALSEMVGGFQSLSMQATAQGLSAEIPADDARLRLDQAGFELGFVAPYAGSPNAKDMRLSLNLLDIDAAYPSLASAFEPAWSTLLEPALPQRLDLNLAVSAIPSSAWRGVAGLFVDTGQFPEDSREIAQVPSLTLDGTVYQADLLNAQLDGTLTFEPGAALFAVGDLGLEMTNLRALIGAMQRSARTPNRTLAQFLTLGSVGLATIAGFAERGEGETAIFNFEFQQDGFPTINGRPLPVGL